MIGLDNMQNVVQFLLAIFGENPFLENTRALVYDHFFKFSVVVSTWALTVPESPPSPDSGEQVNLHASTN